MSSWEGESGQQMERGPGVKVCRSGQFLLVSRGRVLKVISLSLESGTDLCHVMVSVMVPLGVDTQCSGALLQRKSGIQQMVVQERWI